MTASEAIVRLNGVSKIYGQDTRVPVRALDDVTLSLKKGDFAAVAGPSGSGKSTLLNMIGGLDKPTEGRVTVAGQDLGELSRNALADFRLYHIGFVFQAFNLIPVLSAVENAEFELLMQGVSKEERRERVREELTGMGFTEDQMHRRPDELSGGQQQRVAIARALVARPDLVLADEPTANLDSTTGGRLMDMMAELNERTGITFLFATHDPMVMDRARRFIQMRDGRIENDEVRDRTTASHA